jgi:hypothetical protein
MSSAAIPKKTVSAETSLQAPAKPFQDNGAKGICFKIFVIASIILAAITAVVGVLALLASKGALTGRMSSISDLSVIGEVNSYVMLSGGIALFVLGILAWSCQLKRENQRALHNQGYGIYRKSS